MSRRILFIGLVVVLSWQGMLSAAVTDAEKQLRKKVDDLRRDNAKLVEEMQVQSGALSKLERSNIELKKQLEKAARETSQRAEKKRKEKKTGSSSVNKAGEGPSAGEVILYKELGTGYLQDRQFEQAISAFEKALAADPKDAGSCYNLGLLYKHHRNDPAKAVVYLKRYITLAPLAKDRTDVEYLIRMLESKGPAYP